MITKKKDTPVAKLIREGLERLEYRGYDSAGVALVNNGKIEIHKEKGKVIATFGEKSWALFWAES